MVSTAGGIVIAVVVLLVAAAVGWIVFTQLRARRLGVCRMLRPVSLLLPMALVDLCCPLLHYRFSAAVVVSHC
jgi:hypothetical protein